MKLTRRELYDLVWSQPLTAIAEKYETTDNILRKVCRKFNIPLPKSGHWMKIKFGKPLIVEKLDDSYDGPNDLSINENSIEKDMVTVAPALSEFELLKREIENDKKLSLIVPDRLVKPDKLIESAKVALEKSHVFSSDGNRLKAWDELTISVTKENVSRALRFMDTFIKALRARGHEIKLINRQTYIILYNEKIKISCREKAKRIIISDKPYNSTELRATGILTFNIEGFYAKEWKDGKLKLEEQLSGILAKLEMEGKRLKEETIEREKRWAEDAKKKKILEDIQKAKEEDLEKFKSLILAARKHKEVLILREYIEAVKEKAKKANTHNEEMDKWLSWAQNKIDWYDPLVNTVDPNLEEVDKETLTFKKKSGWYV